MNLTTLLFLLLPAITIAANTTNTQIAETDTKLGNGKAVSYPCSCVNGICSCCTGNVLQNFNINMRQRLCSNVTFDPDDFTFGVRIGFNNVVLYQNKLSGRNPPPICLPIPRLAALRVCFRLTDVYFIGRNVHACVVFETQWNKETAFTFNFDCMRLGANGVALVKPEDGGGLPPVSSTESPNDVIEDYDENVTDKPTKGKGRTLSSNFNLFNF